jgi:glycosyltransferase involved in cell wall biosynthesis
MVWNELRGCQEDVPNLPKDCFDEIFALDGGSTDGTIQYLNEQGILVVPQQKRGYNRAYIAAFEKTSCDALVLFHPKGSIDPASLRHFIEPLRSGTHLVIASRNAKGAHNEEDDKFLKPRKWFVLALSALSAAIWWRGGGPVMWDVLHGYRAMRRDSFFAMDPLEEGLSMDLQMVVRAYRLGFSRLELPIVETPRLEGSTHFKAFPTGVKLLRYMWVELRRGKHLLKDKPVAASRGNL